MVVSSVSSRLVVVNAQDAVLQSCGTSVLWLLLVLCAGAAG